MSSPDWDDQRTLLAVLREGSLLGAARALALSQPTVRRRIEALEAVLGLALFNRSAAAVVPTQQALELRPHLEAMERAALAFQRGASADAAALAGRVRVTSSELLGVELLPLLLAPLRERQAALELELSLSDRLEDLIEHEADIALRSARPEHEALIAQRVGSSRIGLYAAPALIGRLGAPPALAALGEWPLIIPDRAAKDLAVLAAHGHPGTQGQAGLRADSHLAQLAAVKAGLGIGPCDAPIARRHGLVPVLQDSFGFERELWLAMPESLRKVRRVAVVFRHLAEAAARFLSPA